MGIDLRLGDKDRERLGCEEWLPLSLVEISIADLTELSERFDFDVDEWPTPLLGEVALEDAGKEDAQPRRPRWQMQAFVWMALHQSGHDVSWDEAGKVKAPWVAMRQTPEPGKDEADTTPSETSDASTTPPSESSSD